MRGKIPPSCIQCGQSLVDWDFLGFFVPCGPFSIQTSCGRQRWKCEGGTFCQSLNTWDSVCLSVPRCVPASVCCPKNRGTVPLREWSPAIPPASHRVSLRVQVKPCHLQHGWKGWTGHLQGDPGLGLLWDRAVPILLHGRRASLRWNRDKDTVGKDVLGGICVPSSLGCHCLAVGAACLPRAALKTWRKGSAKLGSQPGVFGRGCGALQSSVQPFTGETNPSEQPKQGTKPALAWCRDCPVHHVHPCTAALGIHLISECCTGGLGFSLSADRCSRCSHFTAITLRCVNSGAVTCVLLLLCRTIKSIN